MGAGASVRPPCPLRAGETLSVPVNFMLIDLHVYTAPSAGPSVERAVSMARDQGLDAIAIVDRAASAEVARAVVDQRFGDFPVFVGVELATTAGDVLVFVPDLDPFYTREEWRELEVLGLPELSDVVEMVERHKGVVLGAHAYDRRRERAPRDRVFALSSLAGFQVWTSTSDRQANHVALEAGARAQVGAFAGSASVSERGVRQPWVTLFAAEPQTQADLVEALEGGDFWPVEIADSRSRSGGRGGRSSRSNRGRRGGSNRHAHG